MSTTRTTALVLAVAFTVLAVVCAIFWTVRTTPQTGIQAVIVGGAVVAWVWFIAAWVKEAVEDDAQAKYKAHAAAIKGAQAELTDTIRDVHGSMLASINQIRSTLEAQDVEIAEQRNGEAALRAVRSAATHDRLASSSAPRPSHADRRRIGRTPPTSRPMTTPPDA